MSWVQFRMKELLSFRYSCERKFYCTVVVYRIKSTSVCYCSDLENGAEK